MTQSAARLHLYKVLVLLNSLSASFNRHGCNAHIFLMPLVYAEASCLISLA